MSECKIFLYGASGHAKVILEILEAQGEKCIGLFDDNPDLKTLLGFPVHGSWNENIAGPDAQVILSIGSNIIRKQLAEKLNCQWGIAIHPAANISIRSSIAPGTVVMAGASINSCTTTGQHVIINTNASVDHDCLLGDYVHISPNAALGGGVHVGEGTHIGIGACVKQGIRIGKWSVIGAGAVIVRDVPDNVVVVGNPGRIIKQHI